MSSRREAPTKPDSVAFDPATKREFFHASKYSDIVGRHHDDRGEHVGRLAASSLPRAPAGPWPSARSPSSRRWRKSASGSASPKATSPSPSRSGSTPSAANFSSVPEDRGLGDEEEVAGLLVLLARLRRDRERNRVLRVARVAAGVDDHVVVGELGHARDDALHLLVGGVGRAEVGSGAPLDDGRDLVGVLGEQPVVVEVDALGEVVVRAGRPRAACRSRSPAARCGRPGRT